MATDFVIPQDSSGNFINGQPIPLDSVAEIFAYSGNFIQTITIAYQGQTYVQTFTNDGTNITSVSGWVQQ